MLTARALHLVHLHRTRIDEHVDRGVDMLALPAERARYPLAVSRWQLLQLLREYHLFKRVEIFEPAMRSGSFDQARRAQQMLETCRQGWLGYIAFTLDWSSRDVVAAWPGYTAATRDMAVHLHEHMAREQGQLVRLLDRSTRTRHLAQRA